MLRVVASVVAVLVTDADEKLLTELSSQTLAIRFENIAAQFVISL